MAAQQPSHQAYGAWSNTAIGSQALYANTEGYGNTALGYQDLYSNISGSDNVAIGRLALNDNISGGANIAIGGYSTLYYICSLVISPLVINPSTQP